MAEVADGPEKKHPHHLEECLDGGASTRPAASTSAAIGKFEELMGK